MAKVIAVESFGCPEFEAVTLEPHNPYALTLKVLKLRCRVWQGREGIAFGM